MTYQDGLNQAAENAFCDIASRGVAAGLLFAGLTAETVAGLVGGLAVAGLSAHLYATYCGTPPPPPPYGAPQRWSGGQCVGVSYRIAISAMLLRNPKTAPFELGRVGTVYNGNGAVTVAEIYDTGDTDNGIYFRAAWNGGSANDLIIQGTRNDPDNPEYGYRDIIVSVTRNDAQPDLCGNPAPNPPADRLDRPGNITYINREGDNITTPVHFDFRGARIGLGGDVFIPVNVRFDLDPTLNFNGTININSGNLTVNAGNPGAPPGVGDNPGDVFTPPNNPPGTPPGTRPPTPPGVPDEPPPPPTTDPLPEPEYIIRGVIVSVYQAEGEATVIFQNNAPNIYAPNLGHISFLHRVNDFDCWSSDIPVKNRRQIIECPWRYGAIDVRGTPRNGVTFQLSKVYDTNSIPPPTT